MVSRKQMDVEDLITEHYYVKQKSLSNITLAMAEKGGKKGKPLTCIYIEALIHGVQIINYPTQH